MYISNLKNAPYMPLKSNFEDIRIRMTREQKANLKAQALQEGCTLSDYIRGFLRPLASKRVNS